ncbi:MAG: hypothetical protein IJ635_05675 [Bacteroidaceae bacterium]|nr:hypothetical protein [Bacteroidaceae bacterium]
MSKQCPKCHSYNTEMAIENRVVHGILNVGRGAVALGAGVVFGVFHPALGGGAAKNVWDKMKPADCKGYHCCNCGEDFSA